MVLHRACFVIALFAAGSALAQEIEIQAELLGPLSTGTSRKGDTVSARVLSPAALQGDTLEGKVNQSRAGNKMSGQAALSFTFETLRHGGEAVPILADVRSISNSKGVVDTDEEGRVVRRSSNLLKAAAGTGLGGLIGGLAGGGKGAAIGAVAGAAASVVLIEVAAQGPSVRFDAGSKVTLSAKSRSGPALSSLAPNAAPAAAPAPAQPVSAAAAQPAAPAVPAQAAAPAASAVASAQPNFTVLKDDFIPGEKVLLYDDFTDMAPDEAPPHWKVRGASLTLMAAGGVRQIVADKNVRLTPMIDGFPANFTLETEVKYDVYDTSTWFFYTKGSTNDALQVYTESREGANALRIIARTPEEVLNDAEFPVDLSQPIKEAIWIQNGRLRMYLNGQRVLDVNQLKLPPLASAVLEANPSSNNPGSKLTYRMFRIAESTPDFSRSIAASGRYVTHGIYFDTDSDRIRPESAAVIKSIGSGLQLNANLKLQIEGHTDSTGNADHNLELSKRRAEAVKAVLVSQFGIDASRLTCTGLGATKAIDSNDTPQGRAQNRRVEFVRQ